MNAYIPGDAVITPYGRGRVRKVDLTQGVMVELPAFSCWFEFYEVRLAA